ncbi:MAG TPA: hypothetical protein VGK49_05225, partial [Ilumatobacteraceae bacterium]
MRPWMRRRLPLLLVVIVVAAALVAAAVLVGDSSNAVPSVLFIGAVAIVAIGLSWADRRRVERQLRASLEGVAAAEADIRELLDELPEAVVLVDGAAIVQSANAVSATLFARPVDGIDGIVGTALMDVAAASDRELLEQCWRRASGGEDVEPRLVQLAAGDGIGPLAEVSFHGSDRDRLVVR